MFDPTQSAAPTGAPPGAPQSQAAGPTVCIAPQADGSFVVYSEDDGPDAGQPAKDVDGALQLAGTMLGSAAPSASTAPDSAADDSAEAMFQGGFSQARGTPLGK